MRKSQALLGVTLATPVLLAGEASARVVSADGPARTAGAAQTAQLQARLKRVLLELDAAAKLQIAGSRLPDVRLAQVNQPPQDPRQGPATYCQSCVCRGPQGEPQKGKAVPTVGNQFCTVNGSTAACTPTVSCAPNVQGERPSRGRGLPPYSTDGACAPNQSTDGAAAIGDLETAPPNYTAECR